MEIRLLGKSVECVEGCKDIDTLKFLKDNPRVYAVTHGRSDFEQKTDEEQQDIIFEMLKIEPSVRNLVPEIKRHGGLIEPILVRLDRMEVIEGNSRLAAYRMLRDKDRGGDWDMIQCHLISALTDEQQVALLIQAHVKGRAQWSAYEKSNLAYVRKLNGWSVQYIADLFGESKSTIRKRIKAIEMMKDSEDSNPGHFSYYNVLVQNPDLQGKMQESPIFRDRLFDEIRKVQEDAEETQSFTAQDLRNGLPSIIKKPKVLMRYVKGDIEFKEAWDRARISPAEERVRRALEQLEEISKADVDHLSQNSLNSLTQKVKKLGREIERIRRMIGMGDAR